MTPETHALIFATQAHGDQVRKYTNEPYIWHPIEVAQILRANGFEGHIIAAALLHDVLEDTDVTVNQLRYEFPEEVVDLVVEVTDVSKPEDGNRAARKAIDREHLYQASPLGQTLKVADLMSNTRSIVERDPEFAKVYIHEKAALLAVLTRADDGMRQQAQMMLSASRHSLIARGVMRYDD